MLDLSQVTLVCTENRDQRSALSLIAHMMDLAQFASVRLCNWHPDYTSFLRFEVNELHRYVSTPFAMICHLDGYILHPEQWSDDFLGYDFIGAPWPLDRRHRVGNSGFCLKSRRLLVRGSQLGHTTENADEFLSILFHDQLVTEGFTFAPPTLAARFATELPVPETVERPFGFHGRYGIAPEWRAP